MLIVKKLHDSAKLPTVAHPGEDLGFDLYALEDTTLTPFVTHKIRTGVAVQFQGASYRRYGLLVRDRSSLAAAGLVCVGGVVDASYTGELIIMARWLSHTLFEIKAGEKIAQIIPIPIRTDRGIQEVQELWAGARGDKGFGSSGK